MLTTATPTLYSLSYRDSKAYLFAALFIIGNIAVPQLCHLIPGGGLVWLPIYFFTLIAAYKFGWRVGVLTAVVSPLANSALFGMPAVAALPAIMLKSVLLAVIAAAVAARTCKTALWCLLLVIAGYQTLGTLGEWVMKADFYAALQDFRIGLPGMLAQLFGGWLLLNFRK